jgi:hypothetical protein
VEPCRVGASRRCEGDSGYCRIPAVYGGGPVRKGLHRSRVVGQPTEREVGPAPAVWGTTVTVRRRVCAHTDATRMQPYGERLDGTRRDEEAKLPVLRPHFLHPPGFAETPWNGIHGVEGIVGSPGTTRGLSTTPEDPLVERGISNIWRSRRAAAYRLNQPPELPCRRRRIQHCLRAAKYREGKPRVRGTGGCGVHERSWLPVPGDAKTERCCVPCRRGSLLMGDTRSKAINTFPDMRDAARNHQTCQGRLLDLPAETVAYQHEPAVAVHGSPGRSS